MIVGGREITAEILQALRPLAQTLSLRQLARWLCERLDWLSPSGRRPISVAIGILLKLKLKGLLHLPRRSPPPLPPKAPAQAPASQPAPTASLTGTLQEFQPIQLVPVLSRFSKNYRRWKQLLDQHHCLGSGPLCGAQLRYLIESPKGCLGAIAFSAAARRLAGRDQWIGWSEEARRENLPRVINQSRFLILPHLQVSGLASAVLAQLAGQVAQDWEKRHGYRPLLVESFVELGRKPGVCYAAANWQAIALTAGRGRQDASHQQALTKKVLWVYPLSPDFRQHLCQLPQQPRLAPLPAPPAPPPPTPPQDWLEEEFGQSELGDQRLQRRLRTIARDFFARPTCPIPQACGQRAKTKAVYRFLDHPRVGLESVLQGHYAATQRRAAAEKVVLAVQDTTELNYSAHPKTELLGPICDKSGVIGMLLHDTMVYNLAGTPLGLIGVQCWTRDPDQPAKRQQRHQLDIGQKESSKWLASFKAARALQERCPQTMVVSVGDREADIYELFVEALARPNGPHLLVRARQERVLSGASQGPADPEPEPIGPLWEYVRGRGVAGLIDVALGRTAKRTARTARLEIRFAEVELKPPCRKGNLPAVRLWAVAATEVGVPEGVEAVQWLLLTTVPVEGVEKAVEVVQWYGLRFQIEVYHRTLKSGCKIEERQLGNAQRIEGCLAIDLVVAWRIVQLTKLGREVPEVPCTVFFEDAQWKALVAFVTKNPLPPEQPPTLREATRMMAMSLGGFLGRKSDGEPGTETIWRGLQRLDDLTEMWCVMRGQYWIPPTQRELDDSS